MHSYWNKPSRTKAFVGLLEDVKLVVWLFNGPLKQYFSLYRAVEDIKEIR